MPQQGDQGRTALERETSQGIIGSTEPVGIALRAADLVATHGRVRRRT